MTPDVQSTMPTSASYSTMSSGQQQQQEQPIAIHPDALPCLKRQQLENLCIRLGVKSTGKKSELIARLEGFALGKSASTMSVDGLSSSASIQSSWSRHQVHEGKGGLDKENKQYSEDEEDADTSMMLPGVASIRIISKPRESHFVTATAAAKKRQEDDAEMGVVLPKSDSRYGSLSSLGVRAPLANASASSNSNKRELARESPNAGEDKLTKRSFSAASLYPWKKLASQKESNSSDSLATMTESNSATDVGLSQVQKAEMGLGLHASDSQASISSTLRRWLKGEGTSTVAPSESQRTTRRASADRNANNALACASVDEKDSDLGSKRKRSCDRMVVEDVNVVSSEQEQQQGSSPEIPQRRIKPRPSRAMRRSALKVAKDDNPVSAQSPSASSAENDVLVEMQARLAARTAERLAAAAATANVESDQTSIGTPALPPSPLKSMASRTRGRFSSQHEKQFGRMDSIANHYAVVHARDREQQQGAAATTRLATKQKEDGTAEKEGVEQEVRTKRVRVDTDVKPSLVKATSPLYVGDEKKVSYAEESAVLSPQRTEEERAAIRRKLDMARHRRRNSTAVGRKSGPTTMRSATAHAAARGPSAKLAAANGGMPSGFAQKISFAVRGFMGAAARGLSTTTVATPTAAEPPLVKRLATGATTTTTSMLPPLSPSKERLAKKPPMEPVAVRLPSSDTPSSPTKVANASVPVTKKRSAFDLQASLARKPVGYKPYSARETVEMLASPSSTAQVRSSSSSGSTRSNSRSSNNSSSNSSRIAFPASTSCSISSTDEDRTNEQVAVDVEATTPAAASGATARRLAPSTVRGGSGKKTRSSASHAARTSLKSPRKSNAAAISSTAVASSPRARRRSRQPSLQVAGQTMASQMMSARRLRTNALLASDANAQKRSSGDSSSSSSIVNQPITATSVPAGAPSTAAAQTTAAGGLGHGSPRKTSAIPLHIQGRGRGTSSVVERTAAASPKSALQRKSSNIAHSRA